MTSVNSGQPAWVHQKRSTLEVAVAGGELQGLYDGGGPVDGKLVNPAEMAAALKAAHDMGANVIRCWVEDGAYSPWGRGNGDPHAYMQIQVDRTVGMVRMARKLGYHFKFEVCLSFGRQVQVTPDATRPYLKETHQATPHNPAGYAAFCRNVVRQLSAVGIHRYSIGNEVNYADSFRAGKAPDQVAPDEPGDSPSVLHHKKMLREFFRALNAPAARARGYEVPPRFRRIAASLGYKSFIPGYRQMFEAGYRAIHQTDKSPHTQVLLGELLSIVQPKRFLQAMLKPGPLVADGLALHPYQDDVAPWKVQNKGDWDLGNLEQVQGWLHAHRHVLHTPKKKALSLYLTEFGFFQTGKHAVPEQVRARWMTDAFKIAQHAGAKQLLQYEVFEDPRPGVWNTGVVHADGTLDPTGEAISVWAHDRAHAPEGRGLPPRAGPSRGHAAPLHDVASHELHAHEPHAPAPERRGLPPRAGPSGGHAAPLRDIAAPKPHTHHPRGSPPVHQAAPPAPSGPRPVARPSAPAPAPSENPSAPAPKRTVAAPPVSKGGGASRQA